MVDIDKAIVLAAQVPFVKINREEFLAANFSRYFEPDKVNEIIETSPIRANVNKRILNKIARECINYEKYKVSLISATTGIGGYAGIAADIPQYFAHVLRICQKLAYVYGWPDIFDIDKDMDEETKNIILIFMGIMYGVVKAGDVLKEVAKVFAGKLAKDISKQALTKTTWYPLLKEVAKSVGIKITKDSLSKTISKSIPVVSAVISGGLTYYSFDKGANKLYEILKEEPVL